MPSELHRYFKFNRGQQLLKNGKLFFSIPFSYNDIYECLPGSDLFDVSLFSPEAVVKELSEMQKTEDGQKILEYVEDDLSSSDLVTTSALAVGPVALLSSPILALAGLVAAGIYGFYKEAKPDEKAKCDYFMKKYFPVIKMVRTCCFTEMFDNELLWAHYAAWNAGMVISFKTDIQYWPNEQFKPIDYCDNRVPLPDLEENDRDYLEKLFTTKAKCWEYEKEWRLIKFDTAKRKVIKINPSSISAIRLGLRVSQEQKKEVIEIRDRLYHDVPIYVQKRSKESFNLAFEKI